MADRIAELGALQDAVTNTETNPKRLGLAGYIRGLFLDWSRNPSNPLSRLTARGRYYGYFWDNGIMPLSLDFANQNYVSQNGGLQSRSFSDIVTFTRTSNATVTKSDGTIGYAPHNLLTYSEQFDNTTAWANSIAGTGTNATRTANYALDPNGVTTTADRLQLTLNGGTTSGDVVRIRQSVTVIAGNVVFSVWLRSTDGSSSYAMAIQLGATVQQITVTGEWTRFSITTTLTAGSNANDLFIRGAQTPTHSNSVDILVWGAQSEYGSTATTYNPTTVKNLLGYTEAFENAAWTKFNSFVQTNLLTYSEAFDNAAWAKLRLTASANASIAPNGYQTADALTQETGQTTFGRLRYAFVTTSGVTYTLSVYAKPNGKNFLVLSEQLQSATSQNTYFNISTGTVGTTGSGHTASISLADNGYYRCSITFTAGAGSNVFQFYIADTDNSQTVVDSGGIYAWGAQLVQGTDAGAYRRTDSASLPCFYPNHNGVVCAEKLVANTVSTAHYKSQTVTTVSGSLYTYSQYVKAGEYNFCILFVSGANVGKYFNLSTGTIGNDSVGTPVASSIENVGNGWYRCSITFIATGSSNLRTYVNQTQTASFAGDGTSGIYIFGAQLSDSASLDPYVLNAAAAPSAAAYYGARFDYDPVTLEPKGLLIEEQRVNLLLNSTIDGANLATQNVTVTAVAHTLSFYGDGTVTLSGTHSATVNGTSAYPTRTTLTFTPTAGTLTVTVSGTVQFAQLEIGSFATSFIPTAASAVTRTADVATIQGSNFYSWYNQNEGTVYSNAQAIGTQSYSIDINDGVTSPQNRITVACRTNGTSAVPSIIQVAGVTQTSFSNFTFSTINKSIIAYKLNDAASTINGLSVSTDTSLLLPLTNQLWIGGNVALPTQKGHIISQISYYNTRLDNSVLQGLTA